jgi:hypothetical protein
MKLPDGVKIVTGGREYKGEIPDNCIPAGLNKTKINKLLKSQGDAKKKAASGDKAE